MLFPKDLEELGLCFKPFKPANTMRHRIWLCNARNGKSVTFSCASAFDHYVSPYALRRLIKLIKVLKPHVRNDYSDISDYFWIRD